MTSSRETSSLTTARHRVLVLAALVVLAALALLLLVGPLTVAVTFAAGLATWLSAAMVTGTGLQ